MSIRACVALQRRGVLAMIIAAAMMLIVPDARAGVQAEQFEKANSMYAQAIALDDADPRGEELLREAAGIYESLVSEPGFDNAAVRLNLALAQARLGESARSIANALRARELGADRQRTEATLEVARRNARGALMPADAGAAARWSRIVDGFVPRRARVWAAIVLAAAGWCVIGGAVWGGQAGVRRWIGLAIGLLVIGCVLAATVAVQTRIESGVELGVVRTEVMPRTGPGERGYPEAFGEPVRAGTEVVILERRGDWARVRFGDDEEAWVRLRSLIEV